MALKKTLFGLVCLVLIGLGTVGTARAEDAAKAAEPEVFAERGALTVLTAGAWAAMFPKLRRRNKLVE